MSCGCPEDYHMADCPIRTSASDQQDPPDPDDRDKFWMDWNGPEDEDWASEVLGA